MKREIELSQTLAGQIVNSQRPTVTCSYQPILGKIFSERVKTAEIFAYHCRSCESTRCKRKNY